jgi:hypothetical protein
MPDAVHELLATEVALTKLGARNISADEARQLPRNRHVIVQNPHGGGEQDKRRLVIGNGRWPRPDARDRANDRSDHVADCDRLERDGRRA